MHNNHILMIFMIAMLFCFSGCQAEADIQSAAATVADTTAAQMTISATTVVEQPQTTAEITSVSADIKTDAELAAEEQKKKDVVSQFTVDFEGADLDFYLGNTFLDLYIAAYMHWNPQPLFRDWGETFPVYDMELEYEDPVYGTVELTFRGSEIHEILMSDIFFTYYDTCTIKEKDGTEHYYKREQIEGGNLYVVGSCEGEYFGMPIDGGTGPFWVIKVEDGKAEVLYKNVVMLKETLPNSLVLPGSL